MTDWNYRLAKKQLEKEGRTRRWLADQCGITTRSLDHILAGIRRPSRPVRKLMAQALNIPEEDLGCSPGQDDTQAKDSAKAAS